MNSPEKHVSTLFSCLGESWQNWMEAKEAAPLDQSEKPEPTKQQKLLPQDPSKKTSVVSKLPKKFTLRGLFS